MSRNIRLHLILWIGCKAHTTSNNNSKTRMLFIIAWAPCVQTCEDYNLEFVRQQQIICFIGICPISYLAICICILYLYFVQYKIWPSAAVHLLHWYSPNFLSGNPRLLCIITIILPLCFLILLLLIIIIIIIIIVMFIIIMTQVSYARPSSEAIKGANLYVSGLPKHMAQVFICFF